MLGTLRAYSLSAFALAAALLLRQLIDPILGDTLPLVTLFGAVAMSVWLGGHWPALMVTMLGYVACAYLFIAPRGALGLDQVPNLIGFAAYLVTCAFIIGIGEAARRAERRASERGELLRVTLGSIGDAVITTDTDGRVAYLNPIAEKLTGWSQREARDQPLDAVFHIIGEADRRPAESPAARALREGTAVGFMNHTLLIAKDGSELTIDDSAAPIRDEKGQVSGCVLIFRDVSERRERERERASSLLDARLLAAIVESSDDAIISKALDGTIQTWNVAAEWLFGHSAEQAIGRHISLVIPPDRISEEDDIIARIKDGRRVDHFETERMRRDGSRLVVSLTISPIRDATGDIVGASKIARDVTRQRQLEEDRQKFVTLVESSIDFIGMSDLDGVPFYINRAGLDLMGFKDIEEARGVNVRDFFYPEDRTEAFDAVSVQVEQKGHAEIEIRFRNFRTGEPRWMTYKAVALTDSAGRKIAYGTVSHDITERRRLEDSLRKLAADLSEVDRRKNEFLATLAHELRNPLAPLSNMIEVLKRSPDMNASVQPAVDTMERQLRQLVRLVDDLLDLNRITHNRFELRQEQVELASVLHQSVQTAEPLAQAARHDITMSLPASPVYLHADAVRLSQVFANLLNNSCKYTPPGGKIAVSARHTGREVEVRIRDNGAGIPADKLGSIFDMFMQVDPSLDRAQGGLGIGLTLVKRLVTMHGGSVEAHSAGEGKGSEFVVRLPTVDGIALKVAQPAVAPGDSSTAPRRILIVDDNRDAADGLAMLLGMNGHETFTAYDGVSALREAQARQPEVVLLDIGLPGMSGLDVCRRIREQPWGRDAVVIALTGWGQEEDRRKSKEAGFDGHMVKPVDYAALTSILASLRGGAKRPPAGPAN